MKKLVLSLLLLLSPSLEAIQWVKMSNPGIGHNGWHLPLFDTLSFRSIFYTVLSGSSSIYSTNWIFYSPASNTIQNILGTGSMVDACPADTPTLPGNRHPSGQMTIDTVRHILWMGGGVCQGNNPLDMFYMVLNVDQTQNQFIQVHPAHMPAMYYGFWVHDPVDDVLFYFGSDAGAQTHDNKVYCPTIMTNHLGVLSAAQLAAGCGQNGPDDWSEVNPLTQPGGVFGAWMTWEPTTSKILLYGGATGAGVSKNEIWAYNVPTKTWVQKALSSGVVPPLAPPNINSYLADCSYDSFTGTVLFHQTWGIPTDYEYIPLTDQWQLLSSTGGGATLPEVSVYDPIDNILIGYSQDPATYGTAIWHGILPSAPQPPPVLTSVLQNPTVKITWITDEASDSQVAYGTTSAYGNFTSLDPTLTLNHTINILNLLPDTSYHFQALSKNSQGILGSSTDNTFLTGH